MSWPVLPGSVTAEIRIIPKKSATSATSKVTATYTVEHCFIQQVSWSQYNGTFDETESGLVALNLPCQNFGQYPELHQTLKKGCEVFVAAPQRLAGTYTVNSELVCSNDAELGDSIQLVMKP